MERETFETKDMMFLKEENFWEADQEKGFIFVKQI